MFKIIKIERGSAKSPQGDRFDTATLKPRVYYLCQVGQHYGWHRNARMAVVFTSEDEANAMAATCRQQNTEDSSIISVVAV